MNVQSIKDLLSTIVIAVALAAWHTVPAFADPASEAYTKALAQGDETAAYEARSWLAPPYAYDLNLWHGVLFEKAVNGHAASPAYPFTYQDMSNLKVRQLRERAGIDDMVRKSRNDLELIRMISDWANRQYGHMLPMPYPAWDAIEILDKAERGDACFCTQKAALFIQGCNAAGLTARVLGINRKDKDGHTVSEVYNNDFRKWMLVDPWMNCYFERNGIPLSAREVHNSIPNPEGIILVFGENGRGLEYWDFRAGKAPNIPNANARVAIEKDASKGLLEYYYDIRIVMRNDHTAHPQPKDNVSVDGFMVTYNSRGGEFWGPQLHWTDDGTPPLITADNTNEITDFEWPLNEVKVALKKISLPGAPLIMKAVFSTFTPCFSHYLLVIDGKEVSLDGDSYTWTVHEGKNALRVASINALGRSGFPGEFVFTYDPARVIVDPSRQAKVQVKIENPGFEETDAQGIPLKWWTITSNAFGYSECRMDSKVKHSGKNALRASPARDPKTGVEYAFMILSNAIDFNPVSDVVFSIWLKAAKENTPVDIALQDCMDNGWRNYVEQVTVGTAWKKYEVKCRLHNQMNKAYAAFKVYSGTVWADDTSIIEAVK